MQTRIKHFWAIALLLTSLAAKAQTVQSFTLKEAQDYGVENNNASKNALLDVESGKATVKERTSIGLPQVSAKVSYNHFITLPTSLVPAEFFGGLPGEFAELQFGTPENLTANITASQLVFSGPWLYALQASKVYVELLNSQKKLSDVDIRKNVELAYYTVLISREQESILQKNISNLEQTLREVTALNKEGFVEGIDVDRLQISVSNVKTMLANTGRQTELAKNLLKFQMGIELTQSIELKEGLEALNQDFLLIENDQNFLTRAEFDILRTTKQLNELNIKVSKAGYYPSLSVFGSYDQAAQRNEFNFFDGSEPWFETFLVGVQLNIPIFDGLQKSAQIQNAQIGLEKASIAEQSATQGILFEIQQNKTAYLNAQNDLSTQQQNQVLAEKIYTIALIKYREGVGSSLELTSAESSLFQAQGAYIGALYSVLTAQSNLKTSLGY